MAKRTPFYESHVKAQAKIVDFAGWDMPLHYGSQIQEHHQVRQHVGMFDVSHMGVVDVIGPGVFAYLQHVLANNVAKLTEGKALYTCMLNEAGGVIDDLIVYQLAEEFFRLVINAGTREKDLAWLQQQAQSFDVSLHERNDLAMLAVQGPEAQDKILKLFPAEASEEIAQLKAFHFTTYDVIFIARTGYTGEDGFEIILPTEQAAEFWDACLMAQIQPCGLGARDTLRLEAGLNLYGADMDESVTPLESNLSWTVAFDPADRAFIGREALEKQKQAGVDKRLVGLVLDGPGIIRNHQRVMVDGQDVGEVTSGGYSPTLEKSIALARIPVAAGQSCCVEIRNKQVPAQIIKPPFVKHGKQVF
jgi:aminomethyltransferase